MPSLEQILEDVVPEGTSVTTPSGIALYYQPEDKDKGQKRLYRVNGVEVPSISTITKILPADGLPYWGMKVGIAGTLKLLREGVIQVGEGDYSMDEADALAKGPLKEHDLTTKDVFTNAGTRGTNVHTGLERWCDTGDLPNPDAYPNEERGYVRGLVSFLETVNIKPIHSELMVGSAALRFAGRFDLWAEAERQEFKIGSRATRTIPEGRGIIDLKTSSGIYESHYYQVAGYSGAAEESGYGRSDWEAILNVKKDGKFDFKVSPKRFHNFVNLRRLYEDLKGV